MKVLQTATFERAIKKLHKNQKKDLDAAVNDILSDVLIGKRKTGDLSDVFVYKFKMTKQLTLLAYRYEEEAMTLTLLALGAHENFYRDLKKRY